MALLDWEDEDWSIRHQANLLSLGRSGLYDKPRGISPEELLLKQRIDEIYTKWPFYGSRRIAATLRREGQEIGRKTVQRHMREMGIEGIHPGPNLSRRDKQHRIFPYLLRNRTILVPNQVWGIDISYIRLRGGWMYLVIVIDWSSRYLVSWELDQSLELGFVMSAVEKALLRATPIIWNSDQGSHFTSDPYIQRLQKEAILISMDGKGRALDNVITERFFRTIKYEEVYLNDYASPREARTKINNYIRFYNEERLHESLSYQTPREIYEVQEESNTSEITTSDPLLLSGFNCA